MITEQEKELALAERRAYYRNYYKKNRGKARAYARNYYHENKEHIQKRNEELWLKRALEKLEKGEV